MTPVTLLTKKQVQGMIQEAIKKEDKKIYESLDALLRQFYRLEEEVRCLK